MDILQMNTSCSSTAASRALVAAYFAPLRWAQVGYIALVYILSMGIILMQHLDFTGFIKIFAKTVDKVHASMP